MEAETENGQVQGLGGMLCNDHTIGMFNPEESGQSTATGVGQAMSRRSRATRMLWDRGQAF